jgi:endo-1,4-beta-xylanase
MRRRAFLKGGIGALCAGVASAVSQRAGADPAPAARPYRLLAPQVAADSWTGETLRQIASRKSITLGSFANTTLNSNPHTLTTFERLNAENFDLLCTGITGWPDSLPTNPADYANGRQHFDSMTKFASQQQQRFRCGAIVYGLPMYIPPWLKASQFGRADLIKIMVDRTVAIATKWGALVQEWIVVNEAYHNPAGDFWQKGIGDDYVQIAFETMRGVAPNSVLFYNDYDNDFPGPVQDQCVRLATTLQGKGLIDGIGFQMHMYPQTPKTSKLAQAIALFQGMGLQTTITECDVNMRGFVGSDQQRLQTQASVYEWAFQTALGAGCRSIVLAGLTEGDSWLSLPSSQAFGGPTSMPGVWDPSFQPRPAYYSIRGALQAADGG